VKFAKVLARKASAYTQLEQFDQAISYFNQSLLENADPKVKDEMKKVEKLKKEKEAVSYINPEISEQHRVKGNQLYGEGKYPEAIKEYEEAIKRNPKDAKLYANKATALMKLLEHPSALIEINKCLDLDPNYVKGWAKKGVIHQAMKEYHKALEAFEKGIKIDPENEECKKGLDNVRANIMMGQYTESKEEAEERLRHAMADPEIQNILRDPSVNEFLRNIQERPNDPTLLGGLKDPHLSAKINKLIAAGVLKTG
jgi:stress-induced-phosphoprotein 1